MKTMFHFVLTPEDLRSGQGLRLFEILNPDTLPVATLRVARDAVDVQLPPMGDGTQLPFLVPEVRQFLQALHQHWPHSAYFCDVCSPFMRVFALAQARHLQVWHDERKQTFRVDQDAAHLERYVAHGCACLQTLGQRAGASPQSIRRWQRRLKAELLTGTVSTE